MIARVLLFICTDINKSFKVVNVVWFSRYSMINSLNGISIVPNNNILVVLIIIAALSNLNHIDLLKDNVDLKREDMAILPTADNPYLLTFHKLFTNIYRGYPQATPIKPLAKPLLWASCKELKFCLNITIIKFFEIIVKFFSLFTTNNFAEYSINSFRKSFDSLEFFSFPLVCFPFVLQFYRTLPFFKRQMSNIISTV